MKRMLLTIGALAALSLSVGLTGAIAANHSAGRRATVAISGSELGRVLVDGRRPGPSILFERDKHGKSSCTGSCATAWPPLIASGKPLASAGAKASLLGTTKRADGRAAGHLQPPRALYHSSRTPGRARRTARTSTPSAPSGTPSRPTEPRSRRTRPSAPPAAIRRQRATGTSSHLCGRERTALRAVLSLADQRRTLDFEELSASANSIPCRASSLPLPG